MKKILRELADRDQHNLKLQFKVGLGIILFCFCLFTATIIYHFQRNLLEEEAFRQTQLVMLVLESTRGYIREVLRPRMYEELGKDRFIIEAMSTSYMTRVIMDRFNNRLPLFKYRRVAEGARNTDFEAGKRELKMMDYFRTHPGEQEWHGMVRLDGNPYYTLFRPVIFKESCLRCHGDPAAAPAAVIDLYGADRGFQRTPGEIGGVVSISIPLAANLADIRGTSFRMFGTVLVLALLLYGAIWLFFNQLIITNLRELITLFRTTLQSDPAQDKPTRLKRHSEELEELFLSARSLVTSLLESRIRLEEYADDLRQNSQLLQSVFDGISDPLMLFDQDGALQMVNQAFLVRNNLHRDEALAMDINQMASRNNCLFRGRVEEFDLLSTSPHSEEIQLEDGSTFDLYFYPITEAGMEDRDKEVRAVVCFARDITTLKENRQRIQQTEKLVAVGQLAAGVAHEINNPLGVILCYTDIIKETLKETGREESGDETLADIRVIERNAGTCQRIVADLLDFSRTREGRIEKQEQSINTIIEDVLSMVQHQFRKEQITLSKDLDTTLPGVRVDSRRIKQVVLNLLMNAAQAIDGKGGIHVSTRTEADTVVIEIEDDGPGVGKEILDKIFDPFFSTKEPGQGTGLGLSVSYGIMQEHDGEIKVRDRKGGGACFVITLPLL